MNSPAPLVEAHDLSLSFGGVKALSHVNFSMKEGELRCLIGPNGAGKTTFFRLLTGVHRPTSGAIKVCGIPISGLQTHEVARLGVGIKTQIPSLFDDLSVRENIWLSARTNSSSCAPDSKVDDVLKEVALSHLADSEVGKLSHGQRQWVELGIVIAMDPKLVLLDEPTAGMTGEEIVKTAELIKRINQTHAIIVVEHDMNFIKMIASTVTVFNRGSVLIEDTVERVLNNPEVKAVYLGKNGRKVA